MTSPFLPRLLLTFLVLAPALTAHAWRSALYPDDWTPPETLVFNQDLFLQDFSYAGYGYNEVPLPVVGGPVFDVTDYGADPTGITDSTASIQSAIDACATAGGGVVYLPEGLYRVAPPPGADKALSINSSTIVLRGAGTNCTRILNTATDMRNKSVIRVSNGSGSWLNPTTARVLLTADLTGAVREVPVADTSGFSAGDEIVIHAEATPDWIAEHQMDSSAYWLGESAALGGVAFFREIVEVDSANSVLTIDTPVRYALKVRDNAGVFRTRTQLAEIGIEHLSVGNIEHPGTSGWSEEDYTNPANSSYDVHNSWLIRFENVRNGWIRGVHSFKADANSLGTHMLSNGILILHSRNVTVGDCDMQKVQYGGGGGNGYTYRFQNSQEILVADCAARFQRHGYVQSHMRNSGNVFHRVLSQETKKQTAGSGSTSGSGSDHHMHFSQSMLFDQATADRDFYDAAWRSTWGSVAHGLTATNSVYWNTRGIEKHPAKNYLVRSDQYGFGYVIGTSGASSNVDVGVSTSRTSPSDYVEGAGTGDSLEPASLYRDQFYRRTGRILADPVAVAHPGVPTLYFGSSAEAVLTASVDWGSDETSGRVIHWKQLSGPAAMIRDPDNLHSLVLLPEPGAYVFRCRIDNGWYSTTFVRALELIQEPVEEIVSAATADTYVRGDPYQNDNYGTDASLPVKYARLELQREAYFQFPIPADPSDALGAYVELTVIEPGEQPLIEAFLASTSWTESAITWATKPAAGMSLGTFTPSGTVRIPVDPNILLSRYAVSNPLGIGLRTGTETTAITQFASRESLDTSRHPRLVLRKPGLPPYLQWAESQFGSGVVNNPALETTMWGIGADPEKDGLVNGIEFVTHANPQVGSQQPLRWMGTALLEFEVALDAPFPNLQVSTDAVLWGDLPPQSLEILSIGLDSMTLQYHIPGQPECLFLRLKV